ncbi:phosphopantetheine-binding protein [Lysinibacillus fusiformis]|uniref:Acyl carrier protein n=1 Tax=Lysinibacillus fusiformis TaxID=28031 RepID=A0A1E4R333_9BACI|nr:phosphopantetheine-binding protein [Lysinibacillus fusiformis]MBD8519631.1 acyl carrier protein [Lysinibacillus fusiformis]MCR8851212.1 phosphopantetheine-binding protein [Lysinibacillus fusiformis]ODV54870.1 acyl carrier protein [Lysinibacillus fusiformis]WKT77742.1 phosphopantetheine-binding protein [Lysinibacillus fusiformis]
MDKLLLIINEMREEAGFESIDSLEASMDLRENLQLDSLMLAELTVRIEDEFGVDIFEDGIVQTIGEIIVKIEGK